MTPARWLLVALGAVIAVVLLFAIVFPWVDSVLAPDPVLGGLGAGAWLDALTAGATD